MSKIIGYREVATVNKVTGDSFNGFNLYVVSPITNNGDGYAWNWYRDTSTKPYFVSVDKFRQIQKNIITGLLNKECKILFNERGKIDSIEFVE